MKRALVNLIAAAALLAAPAYSSPMLVSYTGNLASAESDFVQAFVLTATSNVIIQTWSFGGGTNAAGTVIPAGGFDPLVAIFSGSGAGAAILTDGMGNPIADADTLSNFVGNCPPAGMLTIGTGTGSSVCGDDFVEIDNLAAGTYTLVLSDANYVPYAVNPGPPTSSLLSDGFSDMTGGVFQTCNFPSGGEACITPTNSYAVDIGIEAGGMSVPEPRTFVLLLTGLACMIFLGERHDKRKKKEGTSK